MTGEYDKSEKSWRKKFNEKGIKCTDQRMLIIDVLKKAETPISAQEIFHKLQKIKPDLRLSTIYRNLNLFEKKDLVKKINLDKDYRENRFELCNQRHHHHLICLHCGEIKPLSCPLKQFKKEIISTTDYELVDHSLKIYGICPECKKSNNN